MKEQIRQWLNGDREFTAGVAIYDAHGTSEALKKLFGHGDYSFTRKKLEEALEQLLQGNVTIPGEIVHKTNQNVPEIAKNGTEADLRNQMRPLQDERTALHNQIMLVDDQEKRRQMAFRILDLSKQINPLYLQLKTGQAPEEAAPAPSDNFEKLSGKEQVKRRANLRSQRTKIKKNPDRLAELPAIEAKIKQLTDLIDNNDN